LDKKLERASKLVRQYQRREALGVRKALLVAHMATLIENAGANESSNPLAGIHPAYGNTQIERE